MVNNEKWYEGRNLLLMFIAFFGIFIYGLLTALPGTVLPDLERHRFLPNDATAGTFLLINAIGAVVSYMVSGPITDRIGKKFTLWAGAAIAGISMAGFAIVVTYVAAPSALVLVFACSLLLGFGANAIVSAGHALVGDIAHSQRNAALNLLDICFGLGLAVLPVIAQGLPREASLGAIFWVLLAGALAVVLLVLTQKFPAPTHPESFPFKEAGELFGSAVFWVIAIALFMYVGAEVAVGKWVVTYLERDSRLIAASGADPLHLQALMNSSPEALAAFFKDDPAGKGINAFALGTLSIFGIALMIGRLISSFLLGVMKLNSLILLTIGSTLTVAGLIVIETTGTPSTVRWAVLAAGIGMGPIFPTSVGLASVIAPRIAGSAMSWVMGIGFAGLLVIPPAVGYVSEYAGGQNGDVRKGLLAILVAAVIMLVLHVILSVWQRNRLARTVEHEVSASAG